MPFKPGELDTWRKNVKASIIRLTLEKLVEICPLILQDIYQDSRGWDDDTFNLSDSFGWGVYSNGRMYKNGYLFDTPKATQPYNIDVSKMAKAKSSVSMAGDGSGAIIGRDTVQEFLLNYEPKSKYIEVVFVAGMYYAYYLQELELLLGFENFSKTKVPKIASLFKSKRRFYYINQAKGGINPSFVPE